MANFNFNKVLLGGRICADPELNTTSSGISVTSFSVAVNRRPQKDHEPQVDFHNVTAWRGTAEFICRYFKKGASIFIVGTLQNRSWTDNGGTKRYATDVVCEEAYFVDSKGEKVSSNQAPNYEPAAAAYIPDAYLKPPEAPQFEEVTDDDELPY